MDKPLIPKAITILTVVALFLMLLLASCKSKQKVVTEYRYSDSLEVKGVSEVRRTVSDTSFTSSLQSLFEQMSLSIDSIVITVPPELSTDVHGETLTGGEAESPVTAHDRCTAVRSDNGDSCPSGYGAAAPEILTPPARISPNNAPDGNIILQGRKSMPKKIVISGISLSKKSGTALTTITAGSDTTAEVRSASTELTSRNNTSIQSVEGKPRSKNVWQYIAVAIPVIIAVLYAMKKLHVFTFLFNLIKRIFSL